VDTDPQVRRLALRASAASGRNTDTLVDATDDPVAMVRIEALRSLPARGEDATCRLAIVMTADPDPSVALAALDQLEGCGHWQQAITLLEAAAGEASPAPASRRWQRPAHAIVALGRAAPQRARELLPTFVESGTWQLRLYAARAAAAAPDESVLRRLAVDRDDNVVEAAIAGLAKVAGQASTDVFLAALSRHGYQVIRAAAVALEGTPDTARAVPALTAVLDRLAAESGPGVENTRDAIVSTLTKLGSPPPPPKAPAPRLATNEILTAANLRRLAAPRARIVIRDVGSVELALFTSETPATVLRFADLAESGYYNGLTFHRVEPNSVVRGGSPGASDQAGAGARLRDEVGLWPHVRGTVGLATDGRDTGDGEFFINLVDNPAFDHRYTVFAQVLNGLDVVDRILEGDVIERVEIIP
jgi:cyclophilin family peptidyl-prolyl cis-trans isomerase/HEAT repeat protein